MEQRFQESQSMICVICRQIVTRAGVTRVLFESDKLSFVIKNVPARICANCGEAFLEEEIVSSLLSSAYEISASGALKTEFEFTPLS